jgi:hypothetical protein
MTAFKAVRFRVKPGRDQHFIDAHKKISWPGLKHAYMIKTGDRTYCVIAQWPDMETLANARPNMIATLESFRDTLEDRKFIDCRSGMGPSLRPIDVGQSRTAGLPQRRPGLWRYRAKHRQTRNRARGDHASPPVHASLRISAHRELILM